MIRILLVFLILFVSLDAKSSVDTKIKKTSKKISSSNKEYLNINKKMAKNAIAILNQKKVIEHQQEFLKKLKIELLNKEKIYDINSIKLKSHEKAKVDLGLNRDKLEQDLVFTIAQSVSLSVILEEDYVSSAESLIEFEVLKIMLTNSKKMVQKLNNQFYENNEKIIALNLSIKSLQRSIDDISNKRKKLVKIQKKNKKDLQYLKKSKKTYKKSLKKVLAKQDSLKSTLSKLNIIKIDEIQKAKERAARKKAFDRKNVLSDKDLPTVKKHGSSYQAVKTRKYRGKKTIPPFTPYKITKKYGKYKDPIYGIKVFNESISMKPKKKNTKVKTVFNGKVIYADKTAVLNNIVIVEHSGGLHTIYANLSQISPNIKKGKKIKKGYTIGRVSEELIFEVTQKSYHINPIHLFK